MKNEHPFMHNLTVRIFLDALAPHAVMQDLIALLFVYALAPHAVMHNITVLLFVDVLSCATVYTTVSYGYSFRRFGRG